jgi:serine/threonine-protein kinase
MGTVYRAHDEHLRRDVAVKVLRTVLADGELRRSLVNEARVLSRLNHRNIAAVYDMDTAGGREFVVLEFVPGCTLEELLANGPMRPHEVARLGAQMARGLAAAHAEGVIHRDVKPANIKVTPAGELKLLDFGVAELKGDSQAALAATTGFTGPLGTVPFMSPEQVRGDPVDQRSDIFSAGGVLYQMTTGRPPFPQAQLACLIDAVLNRDPIRPGVVNPDVPAPLEAVVLRALRKQREERYQSGAELAAALDAASEQLTIGSTRRRILATRRWWNLIGARRTNKVAARKEATAT